MDYGQNKYFKIEKLRWIPLVLFLNNYLIHYKDDIMKCQQGKYILSGEDDISFGTQKNLHRFSYAQSLISKILPKY